MVPLQAKPTQPVRYLPLGHSGCGTGQIGCDTGRDVVVRLALHVCHNVLTLLRIGCSMSDWPMMTTCTHGSPCSQDTSLEAQTMQQLHTSVCKKQLPNPVAAT